MSDEETAIAEEPQVSAEVEGQAPTTPGESEVAIVPSGGSAKAPVVMGERGVMLRSLAELHRFAMMVHQSGSAPKGMKNVGTVAVAIQTGMEAGLTPMHALQAIVVINGVTSWRGQSAVGLIRAHRSCLYIRHWSEGTGDDMKGVCVSRRRGAPREERNEFTVGDAKTAGLWGKRGRDGEPTPWVTYPGRQLMWRAVGFHGKDHWSDVLGGFPIDEEVRDYEEAPDDAPASGPPLAARTIRGSLPPPTRPDPLLSSVAKPKAAEPISVMAARAAAASEDALHGPATPVPPTIAEPAVSEMHAQADVEIPESKVRNCTHPSVPPSSIKPGATAVCEDCGEVLRGEPVPERPKKEPRQRTLNEG